MEATDLERLLRLFRSYAHHDMAVQGSPVYVELCARLADDPARAALALLARPGMRVPNVLLAAVHHLLLSGRRHRLATYYATVVGDAARSVDAELYPAFAEFVDAHRADVEALIRHRSTQTNEVGRSILLIPALGLVAGERSPLALLEVGASAGLNLLPDRYGFRIGEHRAGRMASPVQLTTEARGELIPPLPSAVPSIAWRAGLDLNPLDVRDADAVAWLRALVWPEHTDRMALLEAATRVAATEPPRLVAGDLVEGLPMLAREAPAGAALVVVGTSVLVYLEPARRRDFLAVLRRLARERAGPVWLILCEAESVAVSLEVGIGEEPAVGDGLNALSLHRLSPDGEESHRLLARCHAHGRWIRWLDASTAERRA